MTKKIELWDGYEVELNEQLLDDFDFIQDLSEAERKNDLPAFTADIFALLGGDATYKKVREHIISEKGYFSFGELSGIFTKVGELFPKAGSRAQTRSWSASK